MTDATFSHPLRNQSQSEFTDWFWAWVDRELLSVDTYARASNHSAFVQANQHLSQGHWLHLRNHEWPPIGIPLFAPFAPTGQGVGGFYIQIRPGGASAPKRRLHRLACATINNRLSMFKEDESLEASHRLITFAGMERDFNANNLVPEHGESVYVCVCCLT